MIISIDKPVGPTSHQVVDLVRSVTRIKNVGHAGTLDPLASGVLIVAIGKASTKQLPNLVKTEKTYFADILLGATSTTDDREGEKQQTTGIHIPGLADINSALKSFTGVIGQIPPAFSAIHIQGKRAYRLARQGKTFALEPRAVEIKQIKLVDYTWPHLKIEVITGPGTYIRSLARDLGSSLNTGGYLFGLTRLSVGHFTLKDAIPMEDFDNWWQLNHSETDTVKTPQAE